MAGDEAWDCAQCEADNLCEVRNCKGVTNKNFSYPIQVDEKRWELVNVCPITLLPDDYRFKSIYLTMARRFRFTPDEVDEMPTSVVDFFMSAVRAEAWMMNWEKQKMKAFNASKKTRTR